MKGEHNSALLWQFLFFSWSLKKSIISGFFLLPRSLFLVEFRVVFQLFKRFCFRSSTVCCSNLGNSSSVAINRGSPHPKSFSDLGFSFHLNLQRLEWISTFRASDILG